MISIAGIALGVTALIVVLSVMNGFQKEIRGQLLNVAPHAEIGYYDVGSAPGWQNLREFVKAKRKYWPARLMFPIRLYLPMPVKCAVFRYAVFCRLKKKNVVDYGKDMPAGSSTI